jgi:hypothetical protein
VQLRHKGCGELTQPHLVCSECGEAIGARDIVGEAGPADEVLDQARALLVRERLEQRLRPRPRALELRP